ncbi:hypothetical protein [Paracoccus endophyticus]|uniref:hypothetical protein n=1 Tax=Paracoccus endophyticus TaxID=2233774 RepID=UPI000DD57A00|nr:hypothetical protein [Paracoccus endophyticus]
MTPDWRAVHARQSVLREVILEHQLTASLLQRLWQRGVFDVEILHSAFDAGGYDLVLTRGRIIRHIQLKASRADGTTASQKISTALTSRPAGCVVWMVVGDDLTIHDYRFFGNGPTEPLTLDDFRTPRQAKADATGHKAEWTSRRIVPASRFVPLAGIDALLVALLGPLP